MSAMKVSDVWRCAKLLIDEQGANAPVHAAEFAKELLRRGDRDGETVWIAIGRAAAALLAEQAPEGTTKH